MSRYDLDLLRKHFVQMAQAKGHMPAKPESVHTLMEEMRAYDMAHDKYTAQFRPIDDHGDFFIVASKGDPRVNLNLKQRFAGRVDKREVVCRDLAFKYLSIAKRSDASSVRALPEDKRLAGYNDRFASVEVLAETFPEEVYDSEAIIACADRSVTAPTAENGIGVALFNLCKTMAKRSEKAMTLLSYCHHLMSFRVLRKSSGLFVLNFWDPNHTHRHLKFYFRDVSVIKKLHLSHFSTMLSERAGISSYPVDGYFKDKNTLLLSVYDDPENPTRHADDAEMMLHETDDLDVKSEQLQMALEAGYTPTALKLLDEILQSESDDKVSLIHGKTASGFYRACYVENAKTVEAFARAILRTDKLTQLQKSSILSAETTCPRGVVNSYNVDWPIKSILYRVVLEVNPSRVFRQSIFQKEYVNPLSLALDCHKSEIKLIMDLIGRGVVNPATILAEYPDEADTICDDVFKYVVVAREFLQRGFCLSASEKAIQTLLLRAIMTRNISKLELLFESGMTAASINRPIGKIPSVLHCAVKRRKISCAIIIILVDHGADIYLKNKEGQTPIDMLCERGREDLADEAIKTYQSSEHRLHWEIPDTPLSFYLLGNHVELISTESSETINSIMLPPSCVDQIKSRIDDVDALCGYFREMGGVTCNEFVDTIEKERILTAARRLMPGVSM